MVIVSSQKPFNSPIFNKIHLALSLRGILIISGIPFCYGVLWIEKFFWILCSSQNHLNFNQCSLSHYLIANTWFYASVILYSCFPQLEFCKDIKFLLQEIHPNHTRKIICKSPKLPITTHGNMFGRSSHVSVHIV